jgi:hypothetical protein
LVEIEECKWIKKKYEKEFHESSVKWDYGKRVDEEHIKKIRITKVFWL